VAKPRLRDYQGRALPNIGSRHATQASLQIDANYAIAFRQHPWTWDRFIRLCSFLTWTPGELASAVGMPHSKLGLFEANIRITGPAAVSWQLLLTIYESSAFDPIADPVQPNPLAKPDAFPKDSGQDRLQPGKA
jgi:hypothetical protein